MPAMHWLLLVGVLAAGCVDDDRCLGGICAGDPGETRSLPGPCLAATDSSVHDCSFTYTRSGQIASSRCQVWDSFGDRTEERNTVWTYDSTGQPLEIVASAHLPRLVLGRWRWDGSQVLQLASDETPIKTYDRATFALYPDDSAHLFFPRAELGLLAWDTAPARIEYTWTRTGNHLERTGTDGSRATADLDDAGRMLSFVNEYGEDRFTYDGDRIVRRDTHGTRSDYEYDRGGNLLVVSSPNYRQVYDYSCWSDL